MKINKSSKCFVYGEDDMMLPTLERDLLSGPILNEARKNGSREPSDSQKAVSFYLGLDRFCTTKGYNPD